MKRKMETRGGSTQSREKRGNGPWEWGLVFCASRAGASGLQAWACPTDPALCPNSSWKLPGGRLCISVFHPWVALPSSALPAALCPLLGLRAGGGSHTFVWGFAWCLSPVTATLFLSFGHASCFFEAISTSLNRACQRCTQAECSMRLRLRTHFLSWASSVVIRGAAVGWSREMPLREAVTG